MRKKSTSVLEPPKCLTVRQLDRPPLPPNPRPVALPLGCAARPERGSLAPQCKPDGDHAAMGLGLGLVLVAGWGRGVAVGFGCCLAVGLGGGWALGCGMAAGLGFGWAAGAGFAGVRCRPALTTAGRGAAGALAAVGALAAGMESGACVGGFARGLGGGVLVEGVVVEVDEVVVVVEVVELGRERGPHRA